MVPGHLVYLRATVRGFAGKWLWVSWSVISSKSHERVTGPGFTAFKDPKTGRYRPLPRGVLPTILLIQPIARIHKTEITVWVPIPSRKGRFFAQLVIEDNRGRHFASAKTPPFNGDPGIRAVPPNFAPPIGGWCITVVEQVANRRRPDSQPRFKVAVVVTPGGARIQYGGDSSETTTRPRRMLVEVLWDGPDWLDAFRIEGIELGRESLN
jgi:hypothetical protein